MTETAATCDASSTAERDRAAMRNWGRLLARAFANGRIASAMWKKW